MAFSIQINAQNAEKVLEGIKFKDVRDIANDSTLEATRKLSDHGIKGMSPAVLTGFGDYARAIFENMQGGLKSRVAEPMVIAESGQKLLKDEIIAGMHGSGKVNLGVLAETVIHDFARDVAREIKKKYNIRGY
jgi:hypothetical protein